MAINPRKSLYLSVYDKLSVLSGVKEVTRWNNQFNSEKQEEGLRLPALFIQIGNKIKGTTASNYFLQKGDILVTIHYGINIAKKNIGTEDFDLAQQIYEALQGQCEVSNDYFEISKLDRLDDVEDNDYDGLYHGKVVFRAYVQDLTAQSSQQTTTVEDVVIKGTINTTKEF